jgi:3-isopropylmalate/(R)-2-methylmalate dehydratase large subunit
MLMSKPTTLYDKIWNDHLVHEADDGTCLIYIDRHLVHEVTSPQAFEGLRANGRKVRAPNKTLAVVDHNIPTTDRSKPNPDPESIEQMRVMAENAKQFGIEYYDEFDKRPAPPSSVATATPRPTAPLARWRTASAPRKSSMCWQRKP